MLVLLLFNQCSNDKNYTINGQVLEAYLGDNIANVDLSVYFSELNGGVYSTGYTLVAEATTNSEGKFELKFDEVSAVDFLLRVEKKGYFTREFIFQRNDWQVNEKNTELLRIYETAQLNVKIVGTTSQWKYLFKLADHSEECETCCEVSSYVVERGIQDDKVCDVFANQTINYEYTNLLLGEGSKKTGSIFIKPGLNLVEINVN